MVSTDARRDEDVAPGGAVDVGNLRGDGGEWDRLEGSGVGRGEHSGATLDRVAELAEHLLDCLGRLLRQLQQSLFGCHSTPSRRSSTSSARRLPRRPGLARWIGISWAQIVTPSVIGTPKRTTSPTSRVSSSAIVISTEA